MDPEVLLPLLWPHVRFGLKITLERDVRRLVRFLASDKAWIKTLQVALVRAQSRRLIFAA